MLLLAARLCVAMGLLVFLQCNVCETESSLPNAAALKAAVCFVLSRCWLQISTHSFDILSEDFCDFLLSLQMNTEILPIIRPSPLPFMYFQIHYSFIILPFYAVCYTFLTASLNKPDISK